MTPWPIISALMALRKRRCRVLPVRSSFLPAIAHHLLAAKSQVSQKMAQRPGKLCEFFLKVYFRLIAAGIQPRYSIGQLSESLGHDLLPRGPRRRLMFWFTFGRSTVTENRSPKTFGDTRSPMAKALDLVSQITSIGLTSVLPSLGGYFLDQWLATELLFVILGLVFGLAMAGLQLKKLVQKLEQGNT